MDRMTKQQATQILPTLLEKNNAITSFGPWCLIKELHLLFIHSAEPFLCCILVANLLKAVIKLPQ